ncbi:MAG: ABC transporter substrate-binding protein [Dehalococcoidia bacterium]|nr:ABC transporter substrate-binding protein [Dehalococcoidia bacterium]
MNGKRLSGILVLALLLALALSACAPAAAPTPAPTKAPAAASPAAAAPTAAAAAPTAVAVAPTTKPAATAAPATVRFASPGALSDAGVFIAIENGYFKELNVDVKIETVQSAAVAIAPLAAGDLDVAGGVVSTALLNAIDRGVALKLVATKGGAIKGFDASQMIIRKDLIDSGKVKDVKDVKGMTISLANVQSGAEAETAQFLKQGGLTVKDINLTVLGYPEQLVAYGNKAIDLGIQNEPLIAQAVEQGLAVKWAPGAFSTFYGGEYQVASLQFSEPFSKNIDVARRFVMGYIKGLRAYNDAFAKGIGKDKIITILVKYTSLKDPAMYSKVEMSYLNPDGKLHLPSLQLDLDYFKQMGYYTGKLDIRAIVDTQFTDYALQQLGAYK